MNYEGWIQYLYHLTQLQKVQNMWFCFGYLWNWNGYTCRLSRSSSNRTWGVNQPQWGFSSAKMDVKVIKVCWMVLYISEVGIGSSATKMEMKWGPIPNNCLIGGFSSADKSESHCGFVMTLLIRLALETINIKHANVIKCIYWLVVEPPLWKIWVRQLGWTFPIYGKS